MLCFVIDGLTQSVTALHFFCGLKTIQISQLAAAKKWPISVIFKFGSAKVN